MTEWQHGWRNSKRVADLGYGAKEAADISDVGRGGEGEDVLNEPVHGLDTLLCQFESQEVNSLGGELEFVGVEDDSLPATGVQELTAAKELVLNCFIPEEIVINATSQSLKSLQN